MSIKELFNYCKKNDIKNFKLLLTEKNINEIYNDENLLYTAIKHKSIDIVEYLKNFENYELVNFVKKSGNNSCLHLCCEKKYVNILDILLTYKNIDINIQLLPYKQTPLHLSIWSKNNIVTEKLINDKNININIQDYAGQTPLHFACCNNNKFAAELLLKNKNIDKNICDESNNFKAIDYAIGRNYKNIVKLIEAI